MVEGKQKNKYTLKVKTLLRRRERDCITLLDAATVTDILRTGLALTPGIMIPEKSKGPVAKLLWLLHHHLRVSTNDKAGASTRRDALRISRRLLCLMDRALETAGKQEKKTKRYSSSNSSFKIINYAEQQKGHGNGEKEKAGKENGIVSAGIGNAIQNGKTLEPNSQSVNNQKRKPDLASVANKNTAKPRPLSTDNENVSNQQKTHQRSVSETTGSDNSAGASKKRSQGQAQLGQQQPQGQPQHQQAQRSNSIGSNNTAGKGSQFLLAQYCEKNDAYGKGTPANSQEASAATTATRKDQHVVNNCSRVPPAYQATSHNIPPKNVVVPSGSRAYQLNKPAAAADEENRKNDRKNSETEKAAAKAKRKFADMAAKSKRIAEQKTADVTAVLAASGVDIGCDKLVTFPADQATPKMSASLEGRKEISVYHTRKKLSREQAGNIATRLTKWDPYWKTCSYLSCGMTSPGKNVRVKGQGVAWCPFKLDWDDVQGMKTTDWGTHPVSTEYMDGQKRLILRMIPVNPDIKKRADYHLWPKGSFVVVNGVAVSIDQRKQQAHDPNYWSGLSRLLDLTPHIKSPVSENVVKVLTYDDQQFYFCIALCAYVPPATLYKTLATAEPANDFALVQLTREESTARALTFTKQATVIMDDDDDEEEDAPGPVDDSGGKFVFCLTCPFSKTTMVKPVRGKHCKHFQCFDLSNFLNSNAAVYGQRWRCLVCEDNITCEDLQICGLTEDLIFEFRKELVPTVRDRIEFCSNTSYKLLENKKKRYGKKRPNGEDADSKSAAAASGYTEPEVILLD